jgi:hypothetical protein
MAGTWQRLANQPQFNASTMLLLTDGTIMCQEIDGKNWWRLSPNEFGDYVQGTWSALPPMKNSRLYYASAVLADGRVFVAGGEYSDAGSDLNAAEIFDPVLNWWSNIPGPGWSNIGDAPCCVLPSDKVLLGSIVDTRTAVYDPTTNTWAATANKDDSSSEETWTLLTDGTVLSVECSNHPRAEKFVPAENKWVSAGQTPVDLVEASSIEIGPAILLPDGRAFCTGATGHTALFTMPTIVDQPGSWAVGPTFPTENGQQLIAKDAPASLLPSGKVLCTASPAAGCDPSFEGYCPPSYFFEFDPVRGDLAPTPIPHNSGGPCYTGRMLLLPTGEVLFSNGTQDIEVYIPDGKPDSKWRPRITNHPKEIKPSQTYILYGEQINGLSQAVSYGDDATMATNYPIIHIRNSKSGKICYCRTFGHSTMAVATKESVQSTNFQAPVGIETGSSELSLIANGISSQSVNVSVQM